jgi:hypothetical protein
MADVNANAPSPSAAPEVPSTPSAPTAAVEQIKEKATETVNKISAWTTVFTASQTGKVVVMLVIAIAIAFLTGYILYYAVNKTISNQQSYLIPETKVPILATQPSMFLADKVPNSGNGKRASLSFWIYVYDIQKYNGTTRHVLHRGAETEKNGVASPYIYLDSATNKLYVTFAPSDATKLYKNGITDYTSEFNGSAAGVSPVVAAASDAEKTAYLNAVRGITLDYIPLQRWVHVTIVVNEDATKGGSISAYVDGEFVKSVNAKTDLSLLSLQVRGNNISATPSFNITDVDLDKKGNIYTGGSVGSGIGPGFSGMLSMIQFFNYDMNANDVYALYQKGPVDNMLAKVGLPAYGVQSPIYRIG